MSSPDDFDPIADSLRRQFSPPSLGDLEARIAAEAARHERETPADLNEPDDPGEPNHIEDVTVLPHGRPAVQHSPRWLFPVTVALVTVAALLLAWILRPSEPVPPRSPSVAQGHDALDDGPDDLDAMPPTIAQRAGMQLESFLQRGASLVGDGTDCQVNEPPEVCDGVLEEPQLVAGADAAVKQVGECGGSSGTLCVDFDLPADRALLVRLEPSGAHAIVCIEREWTDPHPELPPGSRYKIFRRELGEHILYEITPLSEPKALELMRL